MQASTQSAACSVPQLLTRTTVLGIAGLDARKERMYMITIIPGRGSDRQTADCYFAYTSAIVCANFSPELCYPLTDRTGRPCSRWA